MKKVYILVLFTVLISSVYAQEKSPKFYLGAETSMNNLYLISDNGTDIESDDETINQFNFSPSIGFFASSKILLGVSIPITSSTSEVGSVKTKTSSYALSPFARIYLGSTRTRPYVFGSAGSGIFKSNELERTYIPIDYGIGVSIMISKNCALEVELARSHRLYNSDMYPNIRMDGVNFNFGFAMHF